jgi:hypothetical protein
LRALNIDVGDDQNVITLNVKGSNKSIVIDLAKLRDAIKVQEGHVDEKDGKIEEKKDILEGINMDEITEDEFLEKAV